MHTTSLVPSRVDWKKWKLHRTRRTSENIQWFYYSIKEIGINITDPNTFFVSWGLDFRIICRVVMNSNLLSLMVWNTKITNKKVPRQIYYYIYCDFMHKQDVIHILKKHVIQHSTIFGRLPNFAVWILSGYLKFVWCSTMPNFQHCRISHVFKTSEYLV